MLAKNTPGRDLPPGFPAAYVLANPPFNDSDWFRQGDDVRWHGAAAEKEPPQVDPQGAARQRRQFGVPPKGNANFPSRLNAANL